LTIFWLDSFYSISKQYLKELNTIENSSGGATVWLLPQAKGFFPKQVKKKKKKNIKRKKIKILAIYIYIFS
jgi:hypothetical protein